MIKNDSNLRADFVYDLSINSAYKAVLPWYLANLFHKFIFHGISKYILR